MQRKEKKKENAIPTAKTKSQKQQQQQKTLPRDRGCSVETDCKLTGIRLSPIPSTTPKKTRTEQNPLGLHLAKGVDYYAMLIAKQGRENNGDYTSRGEDIPERLMG